MATTKSRLFRRKNGRSRKKVKKRKSRKTLRTGGNGGEEFKGCARCETLFEPNENILGGLFGGVICTKHRSCKSCWFGPDSTDPNATTKGKRNEETTETKNIPLLNNPFFARKPTCPGCYKNLPPYNYIKSGVIEILEEDEDDV